MAKLRSIRTAGAWMAAWAATSALTPLGCGAAAKEDYTIVSPGQTMLAPASENTWQPPEAIVADLRGCVKEHARDLKTYSHHTKFDLRVTEAGEVQGIDLQSSTLHHSALESCIGDVLKKLSIPSSALPLRSSVPVSGGESQRRDGQHLGVVQVIAGIALGPIIVVAAGVTLGVAIVVVATEEAIEAAKRRSKREKWCQEQLYTCVGRRLECSACFLKCKRHGTWDDLNCPRSN